MMMGKQGFIVLLYKYAYHEHFQNKLLKQKGLEGKMIIYC